MNHIDPYQLGLDKNSANHVALSPLSFIARAAFALPKTSTGENPKFVLRERLESFRAVE